MKFFLVISFFYFFQSCITPSAGRSSQTSREHLLLPKAGEHPNAPVVDIEKEKRTPQTSHHPSQNHTREGQSHDVGKVPAPLAANNCKVLDHLRSVPGYMESLQVVITKVNQTCAMSDGQLGFSEDSFWTAMAFPCTAGKGQFEVRGRIYNPNMVTFKIDNDCPMSPATLDALRVRLASVKGSFLRGDKLLALTPFSLSFWESMDYPDAGVGTGMSMFSPAFLKDGWKKFQAKNPLRFKIYGQENAWVADKHFFEADIEVQQDSLKTFVVKLQSVRVLSEKDLEMVHKKCQRLTPKRDCSSIAPL